MYLLDVVTSPAPRLSFSFPVDICYLPVPVLLLSTDYGHHPPKMSDEYAVAEFIREQVPDWDDEVKATARFKAFSGQRSDWEPRYTFWRDLIIKIARRFDLIFISSFQMKSGWFNRGGLVPLCLNDVLLDMYKAGDLLRMTDLGDPTSGRLSQLLKKMIHFSSSFRSTSSDIFSDHLILLIMLEDKAHDVIKALSESHWTSSCITTMSKFESLFREHNEAYAVLSYLSGHGKAKYLSIKKKQLIEGVKVSLSSAAVSSNPGLDSDKLQLIWTLEELQQQLDMIDKQYERSRKAALAALKSGNRNTALRNARQLKICSESRDKLASFFNQVEGVLRVIVDAESTKKVSEAIHIGARAIKETKMDVKEVELCLQELDEFMGSQEQVHKALESTSYDVADDEDVEEELKKLELQDEIHLVSTPKFGEEVEGSASNGLETEDSISNAISDLKLEDLPPDLYIKSSATKRTHRLEPEAG